MIAIISFRRILTLSSFPLLLLAIWPRRWQRISPCQSVQRNASWPQFVTLFLTSVIFKVLGSWIPPGNNYDSDNHAADITFFYFRSTVLASAIDQRFPSTPLSLDFSLRLPQSIISTASAPAPELASNIHTPPSTPDPTMVQTPELRPASAFVLNNATNDVLNSMDATQLRKFILTPHPVLPHQASIFCLLFLLSPTLLHPKWIASADLLLPLGWQDTLVRSISLIVRRVSILFSGRLRLCFVFRKG